MKWNDRVRIRRKELKLTQEQLAAKLGYKSKSSINKIEMGAADIGRSKLVSMANALDCSPAWLLGLTDNQKEGAEKITPPSLDDEFTSIFKRLSAENREKVLDYALWLLQSRERK